MVAVKKNDFVELEFSGYANGELFDSTKLEEVKLLNPNAEAKPMIVSIGQGMILPAFDKDLEGKEIGKEYSLELKPTEAFGERRKELVKMVPLNAFDEKKVYPRPGMTLALDNRIVKILSVSGGRVMIDFNNLLAGKDIKYVYTIKKMVTDEKEKATALFEAVFRFVPKFEIKDKIVITGPKLLEHYVKTFSPKFKEMVGKELDFVEEKVEKKDKEKVAEENKQ